MTSTVSTAGSAEDSPHGVVSAAAIEGHRTGHQEREVRPASQEADSQGSDDDDDNESSTQSESTWLFRAQYKTDELRKLFNLPESENVCDEYVCALRKKILLQGRLYICEHYLCFHSSLFGYTKDKVIPLKDVTNVRKRKNCGFPNSIEVLWRGGKREFFTSFLSREDAYRLIMIAWHQNSGYAKLFGSASGVEAAAVPNLAQAASKHQSAGAAAFRASAAPNITSSGHSDTELQHGEASRRSRFGQMISTLAAGAQGNLPPPPPPRSQASSRRVRRREGAQEEDAESSQESVSYSGERQNGGGSAGAQSAFQRMAQTSLDGSDACATDVPDSDAPSDDEGAFNGRARAQNEVHWEPHSGPAPPVSGDMVRITDGVLAADVREVFMRLLADERFFRTFHEGRDDRSVAVSPWRQHPGMGRVRELTFVSPVKMRLGISPSVAHCHQTQRYRLFAGGAHLVFESSQTMNDIPFGDHFRVESRWDFTQQPPGPGSQPRTMAVNHVGIPFAKQTMWKKAIEKGTLDSCREVHEDLLAKAQKVVAAFPVALAGIRKSHSALLEEEAAGRAAQQPASLPPRLGKEGPREGGPDNVQQLLDRIPPEFRSDVANMLLANANHRDGASPLGSARGQQRKLSHALSGGNPRRNSDYPGAKGAQHRRGSTRSGASAMLNACGGLMAALWRWLGKYVAFRHVLLAVALLAILYLQVLLLQASRQQQAPQPSTALQSADAPELVWAQRIELMQVEAAALAQRLELLQVELAAAATHLGSL